MSAPRTVAFPEHFPLLPAAQRLVELTGDAGLPYRIWFEAALDGRVERPLEGLVRAADGETPALGECKDALRYVGYLLDRFDVTPEIAARHFRAFRESGFLLFREGEEGGDEGTRWLRFIVARFWETNPCFRRGYFDERQRGAYARAAKAHLRDAELLAATHAKLLESRGELAGFQAELGERDVDPESIERAMALVMRLDRASARDTRRHYDPDLVAQAARVRAAHLGDGTIDRVIHWILHNRHSPDYETQTEKVLRCFEWYVRESA